MADAPMSMAQAVMLGRKATVPPKAGGCVAKEGKA